MKDWKTTVAGVIAGALIALQTVQQNLTQGTPINWWHIFAGFAVATLGYLVPDKAVKAIGGTTTVLVLLFITPLVQSCASTQTALVSGTLSNGDKFPLCLEVTEKSPIGGVTLLAAFCANVQTDIDNKAAQYRTMYGPNAKITELIGPEKRQLN